jgi:hypothetical protein
MEAIFRAALWQQFGAAIDMLENALDACPEDVWSDRSRQPQYWYLVFHTLFWLDLYLSSREGFAPPAPYGLEELDPAGVFPERVYSKTELRAYLAHGREECRATIAALTDETAREPRVFGSVQGPLLEILLYSMRHVQHHAAQLNLILRQATDSAPDWVGKTQRRLAGD